MSSMNQTILRLLKEAGSLSLDSLVVFIIFYNELKGQSIEEIIDRLSKKDGNFIVKNTLYKRYKSLFA